jgi:hypothetical protein
LGLIFLVRGVDAKPNTIFNRFHPMHKASLDLNASRGRNNLNNITLHNCNLAFGQDGQVTEIMCVL